MVGTPFTEEFAPLPADWPARLADLSGEGRVVLGTDFPNIPYAYWRQLEAIRSWAAADDRLGEGFLRSVLHDAPAAPALGCADPPGGMIDGPDRVMMEGPAACRTVGGQGEGGDWFRLRAVDQEKRAEEGDDDLDNHPSQRYKRREQYSARVPARCLTASD